MKRKTVVGAVSREVRDLPDGTTQRVTTYTGGNYAPIRCVDKSDIKAGHVFITVWRPAEHQK